MSDFSSGRFFTLLRRELQEYRNSLLWTPIVVAAVFASVMLLSVLLANRISAMGDAVMEVIMEEPSLTGLNISIRIDEHDEEIRHDYRIETESQEQTNDTEWDFSRDWHFKPDPGKPRDERKTGVIVGEGNLNPVLQVLHNFMLTLLFLVTAHYLLGCLYNDRRDRSILFWKSMPVSDGQEVISKFAVAMVVAPAVYIALSLLTQVISSLLAMLLVWRMDKDPFELVLGNLDFGALLFNQVAGWILTALWVAPVYGWLMLASAAARRSPFLLAVAPVIGLSILERVVLGSDFVGRAVARHLPHANESGAVGFYVAGPDWAAQDLASLAAGLLFTAIALWTAAWLRRTRFEI